MFSYICIISASTKIVCRCLSLLQWLAILDIFLSVYVLPECIIYTYRSGMDVFDVG